MRRAMARAATRRGCSTSTGPSAASAGGSRVVLPAPGGATTTTARWRRTRVDDGVDVRVDRQRIQAHGTSGGRIERVDAVAARDPALGVHLQHLESPSAADAQIMDGDCADAGIDAL